MQLNGEVRMRGIEFDSGEWYQAMVEPTGRGSGQLPPRHEVADLMQIWVHQSKVGGLRVGEVGVLTCEVRPARGYTKRKEEWAQKNRAEPFKDDTLVLELVSFGAEKGTGTVKAA